MTTQTAHSRTLMLRTLLVLSLFVLAGTAVAWRQLSTLPAASPVPSMTQERAALATPIAALATPTPASEPTSLLVPADLRGHRASTAERERYAAGLDKEADLAAWSRTLETRAKTGDADAAATLAALTTHCSFMLSAPPPGPRLTPSGKPAPPYLPNPQLQRCAGFGAAGELTALNLRSSSAAWTNTAAQLGHPQSKLAARLPGYGALTDQELAMRATVVELLQARDYETLVASTGALTQLTHSSMHMGWVLTLCALRAPTSRPTTASRQGDFCSMRFERELPRRPPRGQRVLTGQKAEILHALQSGDFEPLWRRPDVPGGAP